ncbi:sn-glycerol-1-phosphate dehydrogenase [Termitidicoccus mucosus]|uniref:3-dehydroquinate synthase n=1 Tax=Termitidicoccus mucosus TaxID=1184151 RepID=A0A178IJD6_9BACT|nr:3-dehydroquinate synthase [Opitutaceae bacterium TSB47]
MNTPTSPSVSLLLSEALQKATQTRRLEIGKNALRETANILFSEHSRQPAILVADETTMKIAGEKVRSSLGQNGIRVSTGIIFPADGLYAEYGFVEKLEDVFKHTPGIPIAIGSGTINDLTKLAAHKAGREYMCVATAASMDGYTAFGASITRKGSKQTFMCPAPFAVVADMDVIPAAPQPLTASGYADLLAKVTSGADWMLADALGIEAIDPVAWRLVQDTLPSALSRPEAVRNGNADAIQRLTEGLLMSGFAMQYIQSSRAASGAEHQFSHLWDMQHHTHDGKAPSHGFKVGVATVASGALYDYILRQPLDDLNIDELVARAKSPGDIGTEIINAFADVDMAEKAVEESRAKLPDRGQLRERLALARRQWPALSGRLRRQLGVAGDIATQLELAGAPCRPEQIGISRERLRASFKMACYIRRRYTILDFATETGLLDGALDHMFGNTS